MYYTTRLLVFLAVTGGLAAAIARNGWMKSRALIIPRSGTETSKSIKLPTKVSNAATANNTRRNQTSDAAETAVLGAVGVKPEEFSDSRCIASAFRCVSASSSA